jgi:hypothetical protein
MFRQSASIEEKARDLLLNFLNCLNRRPLRLLLELIFHRKIPTEFKDVSKLQLEKEVICIGNSRVDLLIKHKNCVLGIEVKVDAVEQLGQYLKYRDHFASTGKTVYVAGIINRFKKAGVKNDNEPFFDFLKIPRILWSEILTKFSDEFSNEKEFKQFRSDLLCLHSEIGAFNRPMIMPETAIQKNCDHLGSDNKKLIGFYRDLSSRLVGWYAVPNKYGNAPYELHLGLKKWAGLFQESSNRRIVVGLNQPRKGKLHDEPYFALGIMLWNRSWFANEPWFLKNRKDIAAHFQSAGFQIVRNEGSSWHRNSNWLPPYQDVGGLKYVNAFWEHRFSLVESDYCRFGWEKSLQVLEKEIHRVGNAIDALTI